MHNPTGVLLESNVIPNLGCPKSGTWLLVHLCSQLEFRRLFSGISLQFLVLQRRAGSKMDTLFRWILRWVEGSGSTVRGSQMGLLRCTLVTMTVMVMGLEETGTVLKGWLLHYLTSHMTSSMIERFPYFHERWPLKGKWGDGWMRMKEEEIKNQCRGSI